MILQKNGQMYNFLWTMFIYNLNITNNCAINEIDDDGDVAESQDL